jgi:hypothetical protein
MKPNYSMINEQLIGKDLEGSGCRLIQVTTPAFSVILLLRQTLYVVVAFTDTEAVGY